MGQSPPAQPSLGSALASPVPETRLHGRRLVLACTGWLVLVSSTLALFVTSLPPYVAVLQRPCVATAACSLAGALDATDVQGLQADGVSLSAYATYTLVLTLTDVLIWAGLGLLIFSRRSNEWMALLAAAVLVLYPLFNGSG